MKRGWDIPFLSYIKGAFSMAIEKLFKSDKKMLLFHFKDTLKAFDVFRNKQQKCMK